jgi:Bacteriophage tail sheath protein
MAAGDQVVIPAADISRPTPGVYWEDEYPATPRQFRTGVPAFLGFAKSGACPQWVTRYAQFAAQFGASDRDGFLAPAVRGFFENGGEACYIAPLEQGAEPEEALEKALEPLLAVEEVDLLCAPDLMAAADPVPLQQLVLAHCDRAANRFAILDSLSGAGLRGAVERQWRVLTGKNAALYFPWVSVASGDGARLAPPCGHIAGVMARSDVRFGVFKAPANERIEGVLNLEVSLTNADQDAADPHGVVNCLRAFRGRGIRIWGARTISGQSEWKYVNVRRLFLTIARWMEQFMADIVMEPNTISLQGRIRRELNEYLFGLLRQGALQGASPQEAYFVRCGNQTTSAADRDSGRVVAEIGIAPVVPNEFIVVRLIHSAAGAIVSAETAFS